VGVRLGWPDLSLVGSFENYTVSVFGIASVRSEEIYTCILDKKANVDAHYLFWLNSHSHHYLLPRDKVCKKLCVPPPWVTQTIQPQTLPSIINSRVSSAAH
jgi:hypothetical protein